jgi:16S rRNA (adenine1518-N6/adenine1519-N6)-dimethyltransferase
VQKVRPKKSLGQHFLIDKNIAKDIVDSLSINDSKSIIEIGPGTGVLTQYLIDIPEFRAIEIDFESISFLKKQYPNKNFLIEQDVLKVDFTQFNTPIALIGNLPYYISSQIFFKVLDNFNLFSEVVCMIQKEVAERIAKPPGSRTYGILSVFLQTWFDIEYLFTVNEDSFNPPPKVKSGVIRLKRNNRETINCDSKLYRRVVKQAFNQRRKTIRNSLKNICLNLDTTDELFNKRPEQLDVDEFIVLANIVENSILKQEL